MVRVRTPVVSLSPDEEDQEVAPSEDEENEGNRWTDTVIEAVHFLWSFFIYEPNHWGKMHCVIQKIFEREIYCDEYSGLSKTNILFIVRKFWMMNAVSG